MATAQSYEVNLPDSQASVASLPAGNYGDTWFGKLIKNFGGPDYSAQYEQALTANNREYEKALLQEQRDYEEYVRNREYHREDTKMQRLIADYKAAGLNPWLALQGGISGSSAQSQPAGNGAAISSGSSAKSKEDKSLSGAVSGMLLAAAKVVAAVL